ncbi:MAG: fibronectin type III domain-containing protein, partial [Bacteroidia bacterium]|nr:fibronectin type III domain-containing protein [Bacteroidia bacterium]
PQLATFTGYTGNQASLSAAFPGWNEGSGAVTPAITTESSFTVTNSAAQTGFYGAAAKMNIYSSNTGWIISPKVVPTASHWFRYKAAVVNYNAITSATLGINDTVRAMASTNCGATWMPLRTFNTTTNQGLNGSTNVLREYFESLSAYAGQEIMVAIYARRGVSSTAYDIDIVIDDMEIATCFPPSAVTVTNTTISSADLSWVAPGGGGPMNYVYEVRTSGAAGSGATGLVTTGTVTAPSTSVTVTGLSAITAYSVYVNSGCGGSDVSTWTPVKTFTTPAACPAATTPTVTNITGYTAVATWTAGATETLWDVFYGPTPLTVPTATTAPTATVSTSPSYTLAALTPTTGYSIYVRANCGVGNLSAWSAVRNFTTTVSCPAPTTVVISAITPTTAVATWTAGGAETNWFVKYSSPTTTVVASGTPSYTMTGLTPSTSYSIQVKGICGAADSSAFTTLKTFVTPCLPPDISVTGNSRCGVGSTTLTGTSTNTAATIQWYTAPTGGSAVASGSVFVTPTISSSTTYYATSTGNLTNYNVGPASRVATLSYFISTNWGITFDASAATTLASVA